MNLNANGIIYAFETKWRMAKECVQVAVVLAQCACIAKECQTKAKRKITFEFSSFFSISIFLISFSSTSSFKIYGRHKEFVRSYL